MLSRVGLEDKVWSGVWWWCGGAFLVSSSSSTSSLPPSYDSVIAGVLGVLVDDVGVDVVEK